MSKHGDPRPRMSYFIDTDGKLERVECLECGEPVTGTKGAVVLVDIGAHECYARAKAARKERA